MVILLWGGQLTCVPAQPWPEWTQISATKKGRVGKKIHIQNYSYTKSQLISFAQQFTENKAKIHMVIDVEKIHTKKVLQSFLYYLEGFARAAGVEFQAEADFGVLFQYLKSSFLPSRDADITASVAHLHSAATGHFGHNGGHGLTIPSVHFGGFGST